MKRKVCETGRISTLQETKAFFVLIRGLFSEIDAFIGSHELINEKIFNNECYSIVITRRKTKLYI